MWSRGYTKHKVTVFSLRHDKHCRLLMHETGTGGKQRLHCMSRSWKGGKWLKKSARLQQQRWALCSNVPCLQQGSSRMQSTATDLMSSTCGCTKLGRGMSTFILGRGMRMGYQLVAGRPLDWVTSVHLPHYSLPC